jgi:MarR family transcriptional regulator, 2-MHQ and catechol-resistance regulon repressor
MNAKPAQSSRQDRRDPTETSDPRRHAWRMAMEAVWALMARFDEDFREALGIDVKTYDVLLHTFNAGEDGIRMTVLAREVVVTKAGLTAMVDRLEERGLLARGPDPHDRRAIRVHLTDTGEQVFRDAAQVHVVGIRERFGAHMSAEEAKVIADVFGRIRQFNL